MVTNREAWIALNLLPGIGPVRVNHLLTLYGEPGNILRATEAELARVPGFSGQLAGVLHRWESHCDLGRELDLARQAGVDIVTREDALYPRVLRDIHDPPLCLYVRGTLQSLERLPASVAIVGSRHTTLYGVRMAKLLSRGAAVADWVVVSGLARGIDTAAHEAVVEADGCTIAVLGSGLGRLYPQTNVELARRIGERGAVLSEFPMQFPPDRRTFPMRNRVIAGMTRATVVVQAGIRSGSLITASQALDQGRLVFAVPGPVDSPQSRGCHQLIRDGAGLVESFGDVVEELSLLPGIRPRTPASKEAAAEPAAESWGADLQLSPVERKLLALVQNGESQIDGLIARLEEPPPRVLGALVRLEMQHVLRQLPGRRVAPWNSDIEM